MLFWIMYRELHVFLWPKHRIVYYVFWVINDLKINEQHSEKYHLLQQVFRVSGIVAAVFWVLEAKRIN